MELAIISGKGGTGKSSISAAFTSIAKNVVLADCDVDAANLYLLFNPTHEEEQIYIAGQKAIIDKSICLNCGLCISYCRFDAISYVNSNVEIKETSCDGCKLCARICPITAINMIKNDKSRMYAGSFRNGKMVYGRLAPGEENSGKLVNMVRDKAKQLAKEFNIKTTIIDGPPGIGCPVISSITGVQKIVIVTEPTMSGLHDFKRTIEIALKFQSNISVIINKYDLNFELSNQIESFSKEFINKDACRIPFDAMIVEAMIKCQSIIEYAPDSGVSISIINAYNKIIKV